MTPETRVTKLEGAFNALVPASAQDVDAMLRQKMPIVHEALEAFPGTWPRVVEAVRKELSQPPEPWAEGLDPLVPVLPAVWQTLDPNPPAREAVIAALRGAEVAEMTPQQRQARDAQEAQAKEWQAEIKAVEAAKRQGATPLYPAQDAMSQEHIPCMPGMETEDVPQESADLPGSPLTAWEQAEWEAGKARARAEQKAKAGGFRGQ